MPTADHAKALLEEVAARYASITSYSDCGAVHTQFIDNDRTFTTIFSTLYKKPSLYRFEFERPHPYPPLQNIITRRAVVFDGSRAYTWKQTGTNAPQTESAENFSLAIAAATGVSSGSAHRLGRLLIPAIGGLSILDLVDLRQDVDTIVDGTPCYSVAARYPKSATPDMKFVFEKDALLIRGIKTTAKGLSVTELRHSIRVNEPIDEAIFGRAA
ncbi:MAG TPA: hypothetical protein VIY68_03205 [Steroidobacteraceae bacterium]